MHSNYKLIDSPVPCWHSCSLHEKTCKDIDCYGTVSLNFQMAYLTRPDLLDGGHYFCKATYFEGIKWIEIILDHHKFSLKFE